MTAPSKRGNSATCAEYVREMALPKAGPLKPPAIIRLAARRKVQRWGDDIAHLEQRIATPDAGPNLSNGACRPTRRPDSGRLVQESARC